MAKDKTIPTRIDKKILEDLDNALSIRFKNNLITRKDLKLVEGFRLIRRTQGWKLALNDLMTKPKKENMK